MPVEPDVWEKGEVAGTLSHEVVEFLEENGEKAYHALEITDELMGTTLTTPDEPEEYDTKTLIRKLDHRNAASEVRAALDRLVQNGEVECRLIDEDEILRIGDLRTDEFDSSKFLYYRVG